MASSKVVIVDNDEDIRRILARIVQSVGLAPEAYASAEAFIADADLRSIACLLLDHRLPGMQGIALLERLVSDHAAFPVFLISGSHDAKTATRARELGAVIVGKPFDTRDLGRRILASVNVKRAAS
jgi:FixJ family two-component response regulator